MASTTSFLSMNDKEQDEDEWDPVVKVKYGDILKRFVVFVQKSSNSIEYDMNNLRIKISTLFKFSNDADLVLTYVDEDGDVVALDNDSEWRDAVLIQRLNPLRITVQLKPHGSYSRPSAVRTSEYNSDISSDSVNRSHNMLPGLAAELNSTIVKSLKPVPDPVRGVLTKLSHDVIQTASTAPVLSDLLSLLSKMQLANVCQSSQEPIGQPVNTLRGSPRVGDLNICEESKVSNDPQNQIPKVLPQTNFVSPVSENVHKMHEGCHSSQCLGSTSYAPMDFDQNMSKEQKDNFEVHRNGKSVLAAEPTIQFGTQGCNCTLGNFDKQNPAVTSMFLHGNNSSDKRPSDVTSQLPFGFPSQGDDAFGNRHAASSAIPCTSTRRPSDAASRCPFNTMFSFPPNVNFSCKGNVLQNVHGAPNFSYHSPTPHPYKRSSSCHDHTSRTFHRGVICDGCGMHPIMGPRYKSTVKENFDLCGTCFRDMGKETEYTRIDWSAFHFPKPKKDHHKHKSQKLRNRFLATIESINTAKLIRPKLGSCFIRDVTVWDGTVMRPFTRFTKIWRMHNNGSIAWPFGTKLVWVRGDHLGAFSAELEIPEMGFPVDEELDVAVDFVSPSVLGQYTSFWQMISPSGQKFGEEVWVIIQVDDQPSTASSCAPPPSLNLNLPPEISLLSDSDAAKLLNQIPADAGVNKILDELLEFSNPLMLNSAQQDDISPVSLIEVPIATTTVSYPAIDAQETYPQVLNPVDPDLSNSIQKNGASALPQPSNPILPSTSLVGFPPPSSPVSNLGIDIPDTLPTVSYPLIDIYDSNYLPSNVLTEENTVEQTLLRELEEMGFKQIDLNKEVLRQNDYDLEQSVEDLCGFDEWDPLLKDLQEMGFADRELNRKLLSKNGGSIKRVVMELVTGEKGK